MCCFSRDVQRVSDTNIFARLVDAGRQLLAYAMKLSANEDLAMVLPIPTPAGSAEDAVRFIDLSGYPRFFADLESGFPRPAQDQGPGRSWGHGPPTGDVLEVHRVGAFDASFVPSRADFGRLDERFRMPADAWDGLPEYDDWGFAVFKLRKGEDQEVHPMAFSFPTRSPDRVFFPTVHVHHGSRPETADFDHTLYAQVGAERRPTGDFARAWWESPDLAKDFVDVDKAAGLVDGTRHAYRRALHGDLANQDTWIDLA
jgi:hypothetical protein